MNIEEEKVKLLKKAQKQFVLDDSSFGVLILKCVIDDAFLLGAQYQEMEINEG